MERSVARWSTVAAVVVAALLSAMLLLNPAWASEWPVFVLAAVSLPVGWVLLGLRAPSSRAAAYTEVALIVAASVVLVFIEPAAAMVQCVAYPMIWLALETPIAGITGSGILAAAVAIAWFAGQGSDPAWLPAVFVTQALSFAFSVWLGLWIGAIARRSEERAGLLAELEASQATVAELSLQRGATQERERIARDIHDTIAQGLAGMTMLVERARREIVADPVRARETLGAVEAAARESLAQARALVSEESGIGIGDGGLGATIERIARRFEAETGIAVRVDLRDAPAIGRELEVVLVRCLQESLANVRKHSGAASAEVRLAPRAVGDEAGLALTVTDDGSGPGAEAPSGGFGLEGMRRRLELVGGRLEFGPGPGGRGALVRAVVPVPVPVERAAR